VERPLKKLATKIFHLSVLNLGVCLQRHLDRKNYLAVENMQVIAEEELVNPFAIATVRVLYNHHLFTKSSFQSW